MASTYWIKLYYEVLDDPKMGRLPDHIWRRSIEIFLIAGEAGNGGYLPTIPDIAWRLRTDEEDVLECLEALRAINIIEKTDNGWIVTHFAERQDAPSNAERQARYRERQQKRTYYHNEDSNEPRNANVTNRNVDKDKEEDKDTDGKRNPSSPAFSGDPAVRVYRSVTGFFALPGDGKDSLPKLDGLLDKFGRDETETAEYCKPFYTSWCGRRTRDGRYYSKTSMVWLDWALAGEVPPESGNGGERRKRNL